MPHRSWVAALVAAVLLGGCTGGAGGSGGVGEEPRPAQRAAAAPEQPGVRIGEPVWATRTSGLRRPQLLDAGDDVLVVSDVRIAAVGSAHAVDARSGRRLWTQRDDVDGGLIRTYYPVLGPRVGPDGRGGEIVVLPYQRYSCPEASSDLSACRVRPGLEARDPRSGDVRWRWSSPRPGTVSSILLGLAPTEDAVLLDDGGRLVALDPATGQPLWQASANLPTLIGDSVAVSGPDPGDPGPSRVLDLRTGDVVRSLPADEDPDGIVGDVLAVPDSDGMRLEDARTGEELGGFGPGEDGSPPLSVDAESGLAWSLGGGRLVSLLPGETDPHEVALPEEVRTAGPTRSFFAGSAGDGVWFLLVDGSVRTMSRNGALDPAVGPRAAFVRSVVGGSLVLGTGQEYLGPDLPVEVRRIR